MELMGAERPLPREPVDHPGSSPTLRCAQDDHRPHRPLRSSVQPSGHLQVQDLRAADENAAAEGDPGQSRIRADVGLAVVEAGIPVNRLLMLLALLLAFCSGLAGVLLASDLASGQPWLASSYFLDGLTSVLLGSTMLKLGKPNILGTAVGVLVLAVMVRGGALLGWTESNFQLMKGGLLLVGLTVVYWTNVRK